MVIRMRFMIKITVIMRIMMLAVVMLKMIKFCASASKYNKQSQ